MSEDDIRASCPWGWTACEGSPCGFCEKRPPETRKTAAELTGEVSR